MSICVQVLYERFSLKVRRNQVRQILCAGSYYMYWGIILRSNSVSRVILSQDGSYLELGDQGKVSLLADSYLIGFLPFIASFYGPGEGVLIKTIPHVAYGHPLTIKELLAL